MGWEGVAEGERRGRGGRKYWWRNRGKQERSVERQNEDGCKCERQIVVKEREMQKEENGLLEGMVEVGKEVEKTAEKGILSVLNE